MTFGRRTIDETTEPASSASPWIIGAGVAAAVALVAVAVAWGMAPVASPQARFQEAAHRLGITDEIRTELSEALRTGLSDIEELPCDEGIRDRAGAAAVAYYEALLEKPMAAAELAISHNAQCLARIDRKSHPLELVVHHRSFGGNLQLPWSCMPDRWRTIPDRVLQQKLEGGMASGRLPAESLTGTLALIALPLRRGPLAHECNKSVPPYKPNLPLQAAPADAAERASRRKR